ncbi:MAG: hypothetical protein KF810_13665 [Rhizobiaceae bacterium]|nr:hypothetical protein [Rhizobiaceae bacterium]
MRRDIDRPCGRFIGTQQRRALSTTFSARFFWTPTRGTSGLFGDSMYQETLLTGRRGIVLRAISAIDMALWDLKAKQRGQPLAVLLAGSLRPVPAYASGGYYIYNFESIVIAESRLEYRDGNLILSDRPGWGFDFDDLALDACTVELLAVHA